MSVAIGAVNTMHKEYLGRVIILTLLVPIVSLMMTMKFNHGLEASEFISNIYSFFLALTCWGVAGWFLFLRIFGKKFFLFLSALVLLRILANYFHFYLVFAPLAGINSSVALPDADFLGDLGAIYKSAIVYTNAYEMNGLFHAVFGDYDRSINNPGVGIIYGGLFSAFGAYATVAIPWTVIYSAFASLLVGLLGLFQKLPVNLCRSVVLLVFFMPGFFIFPPIYRDNFIIFLLELSAYTAILMPRGNIFLYGIGLILVSILLFSMRQTYVFIPVIFLGVSLYYSYKCDNRINSRRIVLSVIVLVFISLLVYVSLLFSSITSYIVKFSFSASSQSESTFRILAPFKSLGPLVFYPAATVFSLLAPMPWWQSIPPTLLSYQIFSYPQTLYGLTALVALFYSYKRKMVPTGGSILVVYFLVIFFVALLGSPNLGYSYFQIGYPFVLLVSVRYLSISWKKCLAISTLIIVLAHTVLLTFLVI